MPKLNVKEVMGREAKAQARKDEWRTIYEDCYEFALPQKKPIQWLLRRQTPRQKQNTKSF